MWLGQVITIWKAEEGYKMRVMPYYAEPDRDEKSPDIDTSCRHFGFIFERPVKDPVGFFEINQYPKMWCNWKEKHPKDITLGTGMYVLLSEDEIIKALAQEP